MCMARAHHFPTGKRDYPVNMLPFSYPITLYSRILLPCCLAHGKVGPGKWGKKERTGWPFKVTGPEGTITKGNLPPGGLSAKKKPSAVQSHLACQHACARAMPLGLPFGKTKKSAACAESTLE